MDVEHWWDDTDVEHWWDDTDWGRLQECVGGTGHIATLFTSHTWTGLGLHRGHRG